LKTGALCITTVLATGLFGQRGDDVLRDVSRILGKVSGVYGGLISFRFEFHYEIRSEGSGGIRPMEYWRTESFVVPDHWRYDIGPTETVVTTSRLSDGASKWVFRQAPSEYTEEPSKGIEEGFIKSLQAISGYSASARLIGSEPLRIADDHTYDCYVIEVSQRPKNSRTASRVQTFWVDKAGFLVLKKLETSTTGVDAQVKTVEVVSVERFELNPVFPPSFFTFSPPPGVRKVSEFSPLKPSRARLSAGEKAPSFRLKDLNGQEQDSAQFKNRFLVLSFWGSWCGPCREEMPVLDLLYRAFKDKGLSVLGMAGRESPDTSREYLASHHVEFVSCPDLKGVVAASFGVESWPSTFLIGPDGTILYSGEGTSISGLQDALVKTGVWSRP
jgi:peroxiredoxin